MLLEVKVLREQFVAVLTLEFLLESDDGGVAGSFDALQQQHSALDLGAAMMRHQVSVKVGDDSDETSVGRGGGHLGTRCANRRHVVTK